MAYSPSSYSIHLDITTLDPQQSQAWDVGAEPISPNSNPTLPDAAFPATTLSQNVPQQCSTYQEMDPVLRPSEECDDPPPETAAKQHD